MGLRVEQHNIEDLLKYFVARNELGRKNIVAILEGLTEDERACLEIYLAMAAGRFWMMRLQVAQKNAAEGRTGDDILQKNPLEMRNMLIERLKFVTA